MKLVVIGCGRLGAPYAVSLADAGHDVLGVEIDQRKTAALNAGNPFDEPGLSAAITRLTSTEKLRFTDSYREAAAHGDVFFLCIPTPQQQHSTAADLSAITAAISTLVPLLTRDAVIIGKSSVPVGTSRKIAQIARKLSPDHLTVEVGYSPDFLRESTSLADAAHPARIVLGFPTEATGVEELLRRVWAPFTETGTELIVTDLATAELCKYAANGFLATKTSFVNAFSRVCESEGGDVHTLARILALDPRIGPGGLRPGLGWGGSCIGKDLRSALHRAGELGIDDLDFLAMIDALNTRQRTRTVNLARSVLGGLNHRRVTLWGLAFKPGTDDLSDSPALDVALRLHREGTAVTAHDPMAMPTARTLHPELDYAETATQAAQGADLIVVATDWPEFAALDPSVIKQMVDAPRIVDARNILDRCHWQSAGWQYHALGRSPR